MNDLDLKLHISQDGAEETGRQIVGGGTYTVTLGAATQDNVGSGILTINFTGSGMSNSTGGICFVNNSTSTGIELNAEIAS